MKYKKCLYLLIIFVVAALVIVFFNNQSQTTKPEVKNINDLEVVSSNGEYILVDGQEPNSSIFAIYKKLKYGNYQKTFSFPIGSNVEPKLICWTEDKIYFFGFTIASFDLETGDIINEGDQNILTGSSTGHINCVYGIYNGYIYYEFTADSKIGYGKAALDLNNVKFIEKDDVPNFLKY